MCEIEIWSFWRNENNSKFLGLSNYNLDTAPNELFQLTTESHIYCKPLEW